MESKSAAHQALQDQLAGHELPESAGADAFRLVSGALPAVDAGTVLAALALLRELQDELAALEPRLIEAARGLGVSWNELAPVLGVASRQAAERRYLRLRPARTDEGGTTRDERVRNERDRRAEIRAVDDWARGHAGALRLVAARVAELQGSSGLDGPARRRVDEVGSSLAGDDLAALLAALTAVAGDLTESHPGLARSIDDIAGQTDELRARTRQRRSSAREP
jgi:hypothetical protein